MPFHRIAGPDDVQIHYEIIEGILPEDTFFIHGNIASLRWWYPSAEIWKKKSRGVNKGAMIMVDFRGCGKSTAPKTQAESAMSVLCDDLLSLAKSLGRKPLNLVGHSTGGLIAALMLEKEPALFSRAVFLDPVGAKGVIFEESMTAAFEQMKTSKDLVALVMASTIKNCPSDSEFFQKVILEDAFHAVQTVGDKVLRALNGLDSRYYVSRISQPVLVLHGEEDTLLPMQDSKDMAELMKNAQFMIIPSQGHCTNVENPEKFVEIADAFLFLN